MHWVRASQRSTSLVVCTAEGARQSRTWFRANRVNVLTWTPPRPADVTDAAKLGETYLNDQLHMMHNFHPCDLNGDSHIELLCASYEGATWLELNPQGQVSMSTRLGVGQEQAPPARGASEIRNGRLASGAH